MNLGKILSKLSTNPDAGATPVNAFDRVFEESHQTLVRIENHLVQIDQKISSLAGIDIEHREQSGRGTPVSVPGVGVFDFALHDKPDIWISDVIRRGDIFDWQVLEILKSLTKLGDTFVDIGANIGWFSVIGSRLVGADGRVVAVEPAPENIELLRNNVRRNRCGNVAVLEMAAGAAPSLATLTRSEDNQGDHRLEVTTTRTDTVLVPVRRLDDFLGASADLAGCDVIKIDTQGSETAVLRGMARTLDANPTARIVLEFWPYGLAQCGSSADDLVGVLTARSYRLWRIGLDARPLAISADDLLSLAAGELHPSGQGFTDIVAIHEEDHEGVGIMARRQEPQLGGA